MGLAIVSAWAALLGVGGGGVDAARLAPCPPGTIIAAGNGLTRLQPDSSTSVPGPRGLEPTLWRSRAVGFDSAGGIYGLGPRPVVYHVDPGGPEHGWFGPFPDGEV